MTRYGTPKKVIITSYHTANNLAIYGGVFGLVWSDVRSSSNFQLLTTIFQLLLGCVIILGMAKYM